MKLAESTRQIIESDGDAHLATLNRYGSPQVSTVCVGLDGDDIVAAHLIESQMVKNFRIDERLAITFEISVKSAMSFTECLVVHGKT